MQESELFGRIEVRPAQRELLADGVRAQVGARAFDLLMALMQRRNVSVRDPPFLRAGS